jgi:hypothetical protein
MGGHGAHGEMQVAGRNRGKLGTSDFKRKWPGLASLLSPGRHAPAKVVRAYLPQSLFSKLVFR